MRALRVFLLTLFLVACNAQEPAEKPAPVVQTSASEGDFGAVSAPTPPPKPAVDIRETTYWPSAEVTSGSAAISCDGAPPVDGTIDDGGVALTDLEYFNVSDAMFPCREHGLVRLRYKGRIAGDFTTLIERVANMSTRMGIATRILDIDSSGGQVEDAIRAGDVIAESNWTIRVRANAACHSACVLILAAGDDRQIEGRVGIHRIIRIQSAATSRAELSRELGDVHTQMEDYLQRNGAAVAVADLMMTVPNRGLRLLTAVELDAYGLNGANAVQDDLERIRLARKCGEDFVRRKDAFARAFDRECTQTREAGDACGFALLPRFGFPDKKCQADSPLADYQVAAAAPEKDSSKR